MADGTTPAPATATGGEERQAAGKLPGPVRTHSAVIACLLALSAAGLGGCAGAPAAPRGDSPGAETPEAIDAVVDAQSAAPARAGSHRAVFRTIQAAIDAAPSGRSFRILIRPGRYYEKLVIKKAGIALIGTDRDRTVLTYDAGAGAMSPDGRVWGTSGSGTLIVRAPDFSAENLTIENAFDYDANRRKRDDDPGQQINPQGVAVMTDNGADRSLFRNVRILGKQDSLYVEAGRSYFHRSIIAGHVDFILGGGQAVFEDCDIVTRPRAETDPVGWITAASTQLREQHGMVFVRSRLLRESDAVPAASTYLGRPWHPTINFADGRYADPNAIASVSFIDCWMDVHIRPDGWDQMGGLARSGERIMFSPHQARFFEYRSSGPGAHVTEERQQLTARQAAQRMPRQVLGDWTPPGFVELPLP